MDYTPLAATEHHPLQNSSTDYRDALRDRLTLVYLLPHRQNHACRSWRDTTIDYRQCPFTGSITWALKESTNHRVERT